MPAERRGGGDAPQILAGVRVLELGHAIAAPFAGSLLSDFGAEVVKIERPGTGDYMRGLGPRKDEEPLWWKCAARNKKSVTLDFRQPEGNRILRELVSSSDVLVENFRPGTLERHGFGWDEVRELNPKLVMVRISGFGQDTKRSRRPGFGRMADAMSGAAHLTGDPDGSPVHVGFSLADTLSGLMGAFGAVLALLERERSGEGDCVDVALFEPLFRLIDWQVIVYDQLGLAPNRAGAGFPVTLEGVAAGVAQTNDGVWMSFSSATDSVLARLIALVLGPDALDDPRFDDREMRRLHAGVVQQAATAWIGERPADEVERRFAEADAVVCRIYDMEAIWNDETIREREDIVRLDDPVLGEVAMHGVIPKLRRRPGRVRHVGPALGEHTHEVLHQLGLDGTALARLREAGAI
jgi:crotonobetainyl-CoA:carnitine CoA-transferase CaiB-like acyl-CoA transferase